MKSHRFEILWENKSPQDIISIMKIGLPKVDSVLAGCVDFEVVTEEKSFDTLALDPGITIAIVNSTIALAVALITSIAQVTASQIAARSQQIKICLHDGTKISIPINADKESINRLLSGLHDVQELERIIIEDRDKPR